MREKIEPDCLSAIEESESDEDDDDESPIVNATNYGTISMPQKSKSNNSSFNWLSNIFRDARDSADIVHEHWSLMDELETRQHKAEMIKLRFYSTCLATAVVIDIILGLMTTTSRKRQRGVVDAVVLFGTIVTLLLCGMATMSMKTRKDHLGWVHEGAVLSIVAGVVTVDVLLLLWMLRI